ncbi:MAG: ACP S-malonyltransferase [Opitutales bacterium]
MSTGLLFSGQGAQQVGMGRSLYENTEEARALYDEADAVLGWKLSEICFDGPESALTETGVCQPALYVHGYAVYTLLKKRGLLDDLCTAFGLSLGELTALAAAEVFDFATGLRLVAERGRLMQEACDATDGGMASVIGGSPEAVAELCKAHDIEIANFNCPGQIVISGEAAKVRAAVENSGDYGFKMVKPLNVAGAYHSRLMRSASDAYAEHLRDVAFQRPQITVYSNTTGQAVSDPDEIRSALVRQIVSPVRFENCLCNAVSERRHDRFFECGPGKVLAGLARRTDKSIQVTPVAEFDDLPASADS